MLARMKIAERPGDRNIFQKIVDWILRKSQYTEMVEYWDSYYPKVDKESFLQLKLYYFSIESEHLRYTLRSLYRYKRRGQRHYVLSWKISQFLEGEWDEFSESSVRNSVIAIWTYTKIFSIYGSGIFLIHRYTAPWIHAFVDSITLPQWAALSLVMLYYLCIKPPQMESEKEPWYSKISSKVQSKILNTIWYLWYDRFETHIDIEEDNRIEKFDYILWWHFARKVGAINRTTEEWRLGNLNDLDTPEAKMFLCEALSPQESEFLRIDYFPQMLIDENLNVITDVAKDLFDPELPGPNPLFRIAFDMEIAKALLRSGDQRPAEHVRKKPKKYRVLYRMLGEELSKSLFEQDEEKILQWRDFLKDHDEVYRRFTNGELDIDNGLHGMAYYMQFTEETWASMDIPYDNWLEKSIMDPISEIPKVSTEAFTPEQYEEWLKERKIFWERIMKILQDELEGKTKKREPDPNIVIPRWWEDPEDALDRRSWEIADDQVRRAREFSQQQVLKQEMKEFVDAQAKAKAQKERMDEQKSKPPKKEDTNLEKE